MRLIKKIYYILLKYRRSVFIYIEKVYSGYENLASSLNFNEQNSFAKCLVSKNSPFNHQQGAPLGSTLLHCFNLILRYLSLSTTLEAVFERLVLFLVVKNCKLF